MKKNNPFRKIIAKNTNKEILNIIENPDNFQKEIVEAAMDIANERKLYYQENEDDAENRELFPEAKSPRLDSSPQTTPHPPSLIKSSFLLMGIGALVLLFAYSTTDFERRLTFFPEGRYFFGGFFILMGIALFIFSLFQKTDK